jgi:pimeloyl-ACP methyl ester carboxylesterase
MNILGSVARLWSLLAIAVVLVLAGGTTAAITQSSGGTVEVRETAFVGSGGQRIAGTLYIPSTATAETPAPAVVAIHGYLNSNEMQLATAIELSRRGYVVLAIDQPGHGSSDNPAFSGGFGGPAALGYLRSLDIVDGDNVGLTGHSLGGSAIQAAAAAFPEGYQAMVLLDSATGFFSAEGTPELPRNTLVVFAEWEEFSGSMWAAPNSQKLTESEKLMTFFGTDEPVVVGETYGSIADGTARKLVRPVTNHPGATHNLDATQQIVDWFGETLDGGHDAAGQTWWVKEIGTFVAFIGGILAIFAMGGLLLTTSYFGAIRQAVPASTGPKWGLPWIVTAVLAAGIPALTFFWFNEWGAIWFPTGPVLGQSFTNGIAVWALLNGLIGLAIYAIVRLVRRRRQPETARLTVAESGLGTPEGFRWSLVGKSALLALISVGTAYLLLALSEWLFQSDFRLYVLQLQMMSVDRVGMFLVYLIPFTLFFLMLAFTMHNGQRWTGRETSTRKEMIANAIILPVGILVLEIINYVPLLVGGELGVVGTQLLTIVAYPFLPVLFIVGLLSTYLFHKTGTIYAGAFASALLVTWNIVGGAATQGDIQEWGGLANTVRFVVPLVLAAILLVVAIRVRRRAGAAVPETTAKV